MVARKAQAKAGGPAGAKRKKQSAAKATAVVVAAPLDPLTSAVNRLNQINYGLTPAVHQLLIEKQLQHAMDDESPKQGLAWQALQEWRKIDVTTAAKTLDLLAERLGKQEQAAAHMNQRIASDEDIDVGLAAALEVARSFEGQAPAIARHPATDTDGSVVGESMEDDRATG